MGAAFPDCFAVPEEYEKNKTGKCRVCMWMIQCKTACSGVVRIKED